jgi:hypothetical protein
MGKLDGFAPRSMFLQVFLMHIFFEKEKYLVWNEPPLFPRNISAHQGL